MQLKVKTTLHFAEKVVGRCKSFLVNFLFLEHAANACSGKSATCRSWRCDSHPRADTPVLIPNWWSHIMFLAARENHSMPLPKQCVSPALNYMPHFCTLAAGHYFYSSTVRRLLILSVKKWNDLDTYYSLVGKKIDAIYRNALVVFWMLKHSSRAFNWIVDYRWSPSGQFSHW